MAESMMAQCAGCGQKDDHPATDLKVFCSHTVIAVADDDVEEDTGRVAHYSSHATSFLEKFMTQQHNTT